jgi:exopolysaccharide production protein ExoQ
MMFFQIFPMMINLLTGRYDASTADSSANQIWQVFEVLIFANSIVLMRLYRISFRLILYCLLPLICMLIWILLSITWSEYPWLTTRRGFRLVIEMILFINLALSFSKPNELLRVLFRAFCIFELLDLISIAFPTISFTPLGFAGFHGNKNYVGLLCFLALPVFFIGIFNRLVSRSRFVSIFAFLSAGGMLLISQSKSAVGASIVGALFVIPSRVTTLRSASLYFIIFGLFASSIFLFFSGISLAEVSNYLYGDPTLTGRDFIWRYTLQVFEGRPLSGIGYGALWQVGEQLEAVLINANITWGIVNEAHNGYIDILAQLGIFGFVFLIIFIAISLVRIYRYADQFEQRGIFGLADYAIYIIWGAVVYNITESLFFFSGDLWFVLVFVVTAMGGHVFTTKLNARQHRPPRLRSRLSRAGSA